MLPFITTCNKLTKIWFGILVFALAALPLKIYGEWSDLLCRGSAPLMFLLLIFLLRALHYYWHTNRKIYAAVLSCALVCGTASGFLTNRIALSYYGQTEPVRVLTSYATTYSGIYENLGADDSLFNQWFRRTLREQAPIK